MNKLIIALDNMNKNEVINFMKSILNEDLNQDKIVFKINDLLADIGFEGIKNIVEELKKSFDTKKISWMIDAKWNDIPNTIGNYIEKLSKSGIENIEFLTIMASSGSEAIKKAYDKKKELGLKVKILAVTILTSMDDGEAYEIYEDNVKYNILKLAKISLDAGADGIVCSPNDTKMLKEVFENYDFELVTPGIRLKDSKVSNDDQERINTPTSAIENGANHLVIGRPITQSENKKETIKNILNEIENARFELNKKDFGFENKLFTSSWEEILKYIGAIYLKPENGKYVRLTSKVISDGYINIGVAERNFRVLEKAGNEIRKNIISKNVKSDLIMGAQMGSVRFSSFLAKSLGIEESVYTEKEEDEMKLKRHEINLSGKKVILCEDVVTKGSTITKMIEIVKNGGGEVVAVASIVNRTGGEDFDGIPLFYSYKPKPFNMFYDEKTPEEQIGNAKKLEEGALICEKPKNSWGELVMSMRK